MHQTDLDRRCGTEQPKLRACRECVKTWRGRVLKKSGYAYVRSEMRRTGRKMKTFYPPWCFHDGPGRLCAKHRAYAKHLGARRRASKIAATPKWADQAAIRAVYQQATDIQNETGRRMHVDHVIPLNGRNVCGLHIAENLRVLPAHENIKKGNKLPADVGDSPLGHRP